VAFAIVPASLLVLGSGLLLGILLPLRGSLERLAGALLLALAILTTTVLLAGIAARLDGWTVLALAGTGFLLSLIAGTRRQPGTVSRGLVRYVDDARQWARFLGRDPIVGVLAVAVVAALAWRAVLAVRLPILDFDGLAYHLVTVDVWLQEGHLGRVPQRLWSDAYPANGELVTTWLMLFARNDGLARLTGLLGLPLAVVAITGFARTLGADRRWAALAGLVVVAVPAVIVKADSSYIDNLGMAEVAAGWYFGLRAIKARDPGRRVALCLLTGLAIGLAAGTKATLVLPLAGVGAGAALVSVLPRTRGSWRTAAGAVLALAVPALVLGGSWYVKNILVFGNPLWPFTVGPFHGLGSFEAVGLRPPPELAGLSPIHQIAMSWVGDFRYRSYPYDVRIGGFGLAWLPLLALALLAAIWLIRRRALLVMCAVALPVLVTFAIMPMPWWPRYTLFLVVLVAALAALALTIAPPRLGSVAGLAIALLALGSLFIAHRTANFQIREGGPSRPGVVALVKLVAADQDRRSDIWLWHDCRSLDALPAGARVRTDGFQLPHLIVGHALDRQLLEPFAPGTDPRAGIAWDGIAATHLVLTDERDITAATAAPGSFVELGPACRGAVMFAVRAP
jgi:hypothetical protein